MIIIRKRGNKNVPAQTVPVHDGICPAITADLYILEARPFIASRDGHGKIRSVYDLEAATPELGRALAALRYQGCGLDYFDGKTFAHVTPKLWDRLCTLYPLRPERRYIRKGVMHIAYGYIPSDDKEAARIVRAPRTIFDECVEKRPSPKRPAWSWHQDDGMVIKSYR